MLRAYRTPSFESLDAGSIIGQYRVGMNDAINEQKRNLLRQVGGAAASGDLDAAAKVAMAGGDIDTGLQLSNTAYGRQKAAQGMSLDQQKRAFDFLTRAASEADTPEKWAQLNQLLTTQFGPDSVKGFEDFGKRDMAIALSMSASEKADMALKQQALAQKATTEEDTSLDQGTLKSLAEQYRAGDTSVFTNLGRGAQGAKNIVALRAEIARQNSESGVSGADQAMRNAEFFGVKSGQRTLGSRSANIELAATEFEKVLPVVQEASKAVDRTNYSDLNKILLAYAERTGDPKVVAFGGGVNTLINLYARAISPTGVPTVSDKEHAREILSRAWSQGQFDAAVGMMKREINAALESPGAVRDEMRRRFKEGAEGKPQTAPKEDPLGLR